MPIGREKFRSAAEPGVGRAACGPLAEAIFGSRRPQKRRLRPRAASRVPSEVNAIDRGMVIAGDFRPRGICLIRPGVGRAVNVGDCDPASLGTWD